MVGNKIMSEQTNIHDLPVEEMVHSGNRACAGCALSLVYRIGLKALGRDTVLTVPPSCLTVLQGLHPIASTRLPCLNVTFASTAASATGLSAAMRALGKTNTTVAAWAGDGGTSDIGLQALSGACERGDDFIFVCYDNEAYMNTGVQRSGTTPQRVLTTTTPIFGKKQHKKDMPAIMEAHNINYIATASAAYPLDFYDKMVKAKSIPGPKYLHVHTPCPPGWGFAASQTIQIGKMAVETGMFDLYEVEYSKWRLTGQSRKMLNKDLLPAEKYLQMQARFKSLSNEHVQEIQDAIDRKWADYREETD